MVLKVLEQESKVLNRGENRYSAGGVQCTVGIGGVHCIVRTKCEVAKIIPFSI